ncbi:unnamed protein product [Eretmochelys imbricata]
MHRSSAVERAGHAGSAPPAAECTGSRAWPWGSGLLCMEAAAGSESPRWRHVQKGAAGTALRLCPPAGSSPGCPRRCARPGGEPGTGRRRSGVSHAAEAQPGGPCPAPLGADPGRRRFPGLTGARRPSAVGTKPAAPPSALQGEAAAARELLPPEGQLQLNPSSPGSRTPEPPCLPRPVARLLPFPSL